MIVRLVGVLIVVGVALRQIRLFSSTNHRLDDVEDFLFPIRGHQASLDGTNDLQYPSSIVYETELLNNMSASVPVAYVISITSCAEVLDGAAVLVESIRSTQEPPFDLIAVVNERSTSCWSELQLLGYKVQVKTLPFSVENLTSSKTIVEGEGCCGIEEFLKLYAFNMVEYKVVVHLDVDVIVLKSLAQLIDAVLHRKVQVDLRTIPPSQQISADVDFLFVREYKTFNPSEPTNRIKNGIQGAFFVVRPSQERFHHLIQILTETKYYGGQRGWNGERFGGYWGSAQIQGFLSYYYARHAVNCGVELDPCRYNTLGFDLRYLPVEALVESKIPLNSTSLNNHTCRTGEIECEDCSTTNTDEILVAHLSRCYKPWWCRAYLHTPESPVCDAAMKVWFKLRGDVDDRFGIGRPKIPESMYYMFKMTHGYCQKRGKVGYVHLQLP
jgi:hypothetical protein